MKTIFVVDDNDVNLTKAQRVLEGHYRVLTIPSAIRMFVLIEKIMPDLILLDIDMPEMDGFAAIEKLKEDSLTAKIPVIFLTASTDDDVEARGIKLGAVDFVTKPFSPSVLMNRIETHLNIDELIKKRTARIEELKNSILTVIADIVESRDKITGGHIERTTRYLNIMIEGMKANGIYADEIKDWDTGVVTSSARLHDVGKIRITDLILNKPAKLTPEEFCEMRTHTIEGEEIIGQIVVKTDEESFLHHAKLFAGYHHERWDGNGYPRGLAGEEIPLQGRIMAIADVYDALVSERPYKRPFPHEEAVEIIKNDSGLHFDPKIVGVFLNVADQFLNVLKSINK